jgi:vancomycin resistance protein YoaR
VWEPIETRGRDASFRIRQGAPVVVPSKLGRGVPDEELSAAVEGVLLQAGTARAATVEVSRREPDLSTEEAENLGITERLSRHTEVFPYARYREINIGRAAKYLNGTVLLPGETYSMNETVKERTPANGYTVGYIVGAGGRLQEAQGGGVSTVATATWVAAFYAGLEKVEQRAHTIWIPRYMAGLEATVAWGALDLKVRNNTGNGVLITATTTPTSITVSMWGTKKYSRIKAEFGPKYNARGFDTVTDSSPACVSNPGQSGFDIDVDRVFLRNGREVKRQTFTTSYIPAPRVICTSGGDRIG